MPDEATSRAVGKPVKLAALPRWVLGLLGAAGMGGGSVAVFTQDVEAGPVAMIGVGAFFFIVGIVGLMPTRLKIGDNEAEWIEAVGDAFERVIESVPPESQGVVEQAIYELSEAAPEVATRARATMNQERVLLARVRDATARVGAKVDDEPLYLPISVGARPDAVIVGSNSRKVWVIVQARIRAWDVEVAQGLLATIKNADASFVGILMVSMARDDESAWRTIQTQNGSVWFAWVRKGEDTIGIDAALGEAFGPL